MADDGAADDPRGRRAQGAISVEAIDWDALEVRYASRLHFIDRLCKVAIESTADAPAQLRDLAEAGNLAELMRAAHSLRGGANVIMAHGVVALAVRVEAACASGDREAAAAADELAVALEAMHLSLRRRLGRSSG